MIVWWDGEKEFVTKNHILDMQMFSRLLRRNPRMIVVGTGHQGCVTVSDDVKALAKEKKIRVFEDTTENAVEIFNGLAGTGKKVVAFIHTTC